MANALKLTGYDMHFSFGTGPARADHGASEFPEELTWLWRDYNPALTTQTYTQDPAETARPPFRVSITNR